MNERNKLIVDIAVRFREASIVAGLEDSSKHQNSEAIRKASEFVRACEEHGLLPSTQNRTIGAKEFFFGVKQE